MQGRSRGLRRYPQHGVVAGVCAGIADYFDWNVRLLRALLVVAFIVSGFFPIVLAYFVLWYVMDPIGADHHSRAFAEPTGGGAHAYAGRATTMTDLKTRFARLEERLGNMEECVTSNEFELRRELKKLET